MAVFLHLSHTQIRAHVYPTLKFVWNELIAKRLKVGYALLFPTYFLTHFSTAALSHCAQSLQLIHALFQCQLN